MTTEVKDLTEQEQIQLLTALEEKIVPEIITILEDLLKALPCAQLQMCVMDAHSIKEHLNHLKHNGPSTPFQDIPLEQSEGDEEGISLVDPEELKPEFT